MSKIENPDGDSNSLRPATEDDLDQLCEIESRNHKAPWGRSSFVDELLKPHSSVLLITDDETDSKIFGYIVYWNLLNDWQILNITVDLPYRGLGHAKRLLSKVISTAVTEGADRIQLDVRKSNLPAIQLYQKANFDITHIRKEFYSDGEDAYQMELRLK
jgi:[ribosomal protein S18]-alanine N-acetyltransferase